MQTPADQDVLRGPSSEVDDSWLPSEARQYDQPVRDNLGAGCAGKVGRLDVRLDHVAGLTRIARQYHCAPLHLYQPVYLDRGRPDMAFVYMQQSGDGLVQGDRYRIDIRCGPETATHLTTQTPTKVFRARDNYVAQAVSIVANESSVVEYLPDPIVPCAGSRLFQLTQLTVHPSATVIFGETVLPGRVAHSEKHAYDHLWSRVAVRRPDGEVLFTDLLRLAPGGSPVDSLATLGAYDVVASLYLVTAGSERGDLVDALRASLNRHGDVFSGVSELPNGAGVSARMLGRSATGVAAAYRDAWDAARRISIGVPAPDLRKY